MGFKEIKIEKDKFCIIRGIEDGRRVDSRILEERIQEAVAKGYRYIEVEAFGQHGIGGRLWRAGSENVYVRITGTPGQRLGSMGFPNTKIEVMGPASDDVGWLNAGAEIIVHGNATNGIGNAMAQGKIYIAGNIGARGMTMTKRNPRFDPPELWVLGSVGDYFAEFMAGGIAVICGYNPQDSENVLGYRPCVGMVGGKIFFRGPHKGFSTHDAKLVPIDDNEWDWLVRNLKIFLERIDKEELFPELSKREEWQLLVATTPMERAPKPRKSMHVFRMEVWEKELGEGGLVGDLIKIDPEPIPVIATGIYRRYVPKWENKKYLAPCQANCPSGIPIPERWKLIREGELEEAINLVLSYSPFPATVCGYLCPNPCMQACTKTKQMMPALDMRLLGQKSIDAEIPELPPLGDKKIAIVGGGPAGISAAWQLRLRGHNAVVFDREKELGGKMFTMIPFSRFPKEVLEKELERIRKVIPYVHLERNLTKEDIENLKEEYDFVILAIGAQKPRILPVPGKERLVPALEFLKKTKQDAIEVPERVVIIGAGNVGCDAATEAYRLGARDITLLDIQEPLSFGKEREAAEAIGAKFRWPCFTKEITEKGVLLDTGELVPADMVIVSIGDIPDDSIIPDSVEAERGFVKVNRYYQTSDPKIFAIGDVVKLGLLTDAIGSGRIAAIAIDAILSGKEPEIEEKDPIPYERIKLEYFDPRKLSFEDLEDCAKECASCGQCRDCGICITICPQAAISRIEKEDGDFELVVNDERCIGCSFCAGACPCGIWNLVENEPLEVTYI